MCRVTETTYGGHKTTLLSLSRSALQEAGFTSGARLVLLRGKPPHNRWIRVEKASFGKRLPDKGAISLSLKSILRPNMGLKNEIVTPLMGEEVIYFELPATWFPK